MTAHPHDPTTTPLFSVVIDIEPSSLRLRLLGELDLVSAALIANLAPAIAATAHDHVKTLTVDLSGLAFVNSTGVAALLAFKAEAAKDGREVQLRFPAPHVRRVFTALGMEHRLAGKRGWRSAERATSRRVSPLGM